MKKHYKKVLSLLFVFILTLLPVSQTFAASYSFYQENYTVYINGSKASVGKTYMSGKNILVPLGDITKKLGGSYTFTDVKNSTKDYAVVNKYGSVTKVTAGQNYIVTWEGTFSLPVASKVINGQMYVPTKVIEEALNAQIVVHTNSEIVSITSEEKYYKTVIKDRIPTVFMHGWRGGEGTFETMIETLTGVRSSYNIVGKTTKHKFEYNGQHATVFIDKYGKAHTHVFGHGSENKWFVKVVFENDHASLVDQTRWFKTAMAEVRKMYKTTKVNLVTHSMGGLVATRYIQDTTNMGINNANYVMRVNKLVTIATPVEGTRVGEAVKLGANTKDPAGIIFKQLSRTEFLQKNFDPATIDLLPKSKALVDLKNRKNYFDKNTNVFSIAGTKYSIKNIKSDGIVTIGSAYGLKNIVASSKFKYKEYYADHSGTHENSTIIRDVKAYVWNQ